VLLDHIGFRVTAWRDDETPVTSSPPVTVTSTVAAPDVHQVVDV
jgi:hypothetical protein